MFDRPSETQVFRKMVRRWISAPSVWLAGALGAVGVYFASRSATPLSFLGLVGICGLVLALGSSIWRWTAARTGLRRQAIVDAFRQERDRHLRELRTLSRKMHDDRDPQSTQLANRLRRTFLRIFEAVEIDDPPSNNVAQNDLHRQVGSLYASCLGLLERTMSLWYGARKMSTAAKRTELMKQRSQLLQQVERSIQHLDATLDQLQSAQLADATGQAERNSALQDELSMGLEVARSVELRMQELERDLRAPDSREPGG